MLSVFTQTWPAPPPGAAWAAGALRVIVEAGAAAAGAMAAGAAGAGAFTGAAPLLFMPPWPLQAPRPPLAEVVPSLQGTAPVLLAVVEAAVVEAVAAGAGTAVAVAAGADLLMPPWPLQAPLPPCGEVEPSLQVTAPLLEMELEVAAAGAIVADGAACWPATAADLFTPPWPLQAPRPLWELDPSLQVTVAMLASWALESAGAASSAAPSTVAYTRVWNFVTFIGSAPSE